MSEAVMIAIITAFALIAAAAVVPVVTEALHARRERQKARIREAKAAERAVRDAMAAKNDEIREWRLEAKSWHEAAERWRQRAQELDDGWYGQRSPEGGRRQ